MRSTLLLPFLVLTACHHEDKMDHDTATCSTDAGVCTDTTGNYKVGDMWTCPDGCNTCGCLESDMIASTDMVCDDTDAPPDTGTSSNTGGTDTSVGC